MFDGLARGDHGQSASLKYLSHSASPRFLCPYRSVSPLHPSGGTKAHEHPLCRNLLHGRPN